MKDDNQPQRELYGNEPNSDCIYLSPKMLAAYEWLVEGSWLTDSSPAEQVEPTAPTSEHAPKLD